MGIIWRVLTFRNIIPRLDDNPPAILADIFFGRSESLSRSHISGPPRRISVKESENTHWKRQDISKKEIFSLFLVFFPFTLAAFG
jgi:hypothetical protein